MGSGAIPSEAAALPSPEIIRETAESIIKNTDYKLEYSSETNYVYEKFVDIIKSILEPFISLFDYLSDISPILAIGITIILFLILVLLIWHIVYSIKTAFGKSVIEKDFSHLEDKQYKNPSELEEEARQALKNGDYISAVRKMFTASIIRIEQTRDRFIVFSFTNREYLQEFSESEYYPHLTAFVEVIDYSWYGRGICTENDCQRAFTAHRNIRNLITRGKK
jgi:hypothetical protein